MYFDKKLVIVAKMPTKCFKNLVDILSFMLLPHCKIRGVFFILFALSQNFSVTFLKTSLTPSQQHKKTENKINKLNADVASNHVRQISLIVG